MRVNDARGAHVTAGMYSRAELAGHARALGVGPGGVLMVHASVRAVGPVAGGADQIHLALSDALTDAGTLLMYASCPAHYDEVGRGLHAPAVEAEILAKLPAFDARTARAQRDNGTLVEFFRTWPGAVVNDHVARFVCRGPHATTLFATQPWDYAFGHGSALHRLVELDGRILLVGSDHDAVTFLHYAEHVVDVPGKVVARFQVPVLEQGGRVWRWMAEYDTSGAAHPHWPDRFFARITDTFLARTGNRGGRIGDAGSCVLEVRPLLAFALDVMTAVAADAAAADELLLS